MREIIFRKLQWFTYNLSVCNMTILYSLKVALVLRILIYPFISSHPLLSLDDSWTDREHPAHMANRQ